MKFVVTITSSNYVQTSILFDIDLNVMLPSSVINFLISNLAGIILYQFYKQVKSVQNNPNCEHANRIRTNKEFYQEWLLPKLRNYCEVKGWDPPIVSSLDP
eukprot:gene18265-25700_t